MSHTPHSDMFYLGEKCAAVTSGDTPGRAGDLRSRRWRVAGLRRWAIWGLLLVWSASVLGCEESYSTVGFAVKGTIKAGDKPVETGYINFIPDESLGEEAPQGFAKIENGKFETEPYRTVLAGPHIARIRIYDLNNPPVGDPETSETPPLVEARQKVIIKDGKTPLEIIMAELPATATVPSPSTLPLPPPKNIPEDK